MLIPTVIEKNNNHERAYDLYSRLLKDRIIFIGGEINDNLANKDSFVNKYRKIKLIDK